MSLTRRLQWVLALLLLIATGVNLFLQTQSTRRFLSAQLESHAQDTATSLALSLTSALQANDEVMAERIIAAVFDRGYYRRIEWHDVNGETVKRWESRPNPAAIPDWFADALPIAAPSAAALLNDGWQQKGAIQVESHIGYAQAALWRTFVDLLIGSSLALLALITLVMLLVKRSLAPLHRMANAAHSFVHKKTAMSLPENVVSELQPLALALGHMSQQVQAQFNAQAEQIAQVQSQLQLDETTRMPNRLAFLDALAECEAKAQHYAVLAFRLTNLAPLNAQRGYQRTNELLRELGQWLTGSGQLRWFRLSGSEWAGIADSSQKPELITEWGAFHHHAALINFDGHETSSDVLSAVDQALNEAQQRKLEFFEVPRRQALTAEQWRQKLLSAIEELRFRFTPAQITDRSGKKLATEWLARLPARDGELISAGQLFGQAHRLGLTEPLDAALIETLMQLPNDETLWHINLTGRALSSLLVQKQLLALRKRQAIAVEISEAEAVALPDLLEHIQPLRAADIGFGIDSVSLSSGFLTRLPQWRPDYLKLGLALYEAGPQSALMAAVVRMASAMDIAIYLPVAADAQLPAWHALELSGFVWPPKQ